MLSLVFALVGARFAGLIVRPVRSVASGLQGIAQGEVDLTQNLSIRDLIHRIGQAANKIFLATSRDSTQVSSDMAEAAGRQREAVDMVSTTFHEMVATANEIARSCSQTSESADSGWLKAREGQQQIDVAVSRVDQLSQEIGKSAQSMQQLECDSNDIQSILGTIRPIAEQTNLLALNAAIKAARKRGNRDVGFPWSPMKSVRWPNAPVLSPTKCAPAWRFRSGRLTVSAWRGPASDRSGILWT